MNANQYICINEQGSKFYYQDKEMTIYHREDGPAIEWVDGEKMWFKNNRLHREDGPAIEDADGNMEWLIEGQYHRTDGPAYVQANGYTMYFVDGVTHREDGPAIIYNDYKVWYLHGKEVTEEEHSAYVKTLGNNL